MSIGVEKSSVGVGDGSVAFPDITGDPLENAALAPYLDSITNLENNETKYLYWQSVNTNSGTVAIPTGATVLLGEIEGLNALVETIASGKPSGISPKTGLGTPIVVSSFNTSGNYVLSGTPSAFPVAILFVFKIKAKDVQNLDINYVLADETVNTETTFGNFINSLSEKLVPVDADYFLEMDSADSNKAKKVSWANIVATLKTYFDSLYLIVMQGATVSLNGVKGLVPQPNAGDQTKVLAGSGVWSTIISLLGYTPQNILGRTNGTYPSAGQIGEFITATRTVALSLATGGGQTTITSIPLTAGNWEVWGTMGVINSFSITIVEVFAAVSKTNNSNDTYDYSDRQQNAIGAPTALQLNTGRRPIYVPTSQTMYLVCGINYATSTISAVGTINALRVS